MQQDNAARGTIPHAQIPSRTHCSLLAAACTGLAHALNGSHSLGTGQDRSGSRGNIMRTPPAAVTPPIATMQATEFDCNKPANAMETMLCQDEG
jgi:hypothetical protein